MNQFSSTRYPLQTNKFYLYNISVDTYIEFETPKINWRIRIAGFCIGQQALITKPAISTSLFVFDRSARVSWPGLCAS